MEEPTHKRMVAAWLVSVSDDAAITLARQLAMKHAEVKVRARGYVLDSSREQGTTISNMPADFFQPSGVNVMAEIPVLLTEQQVVELDVENTERELVECKERLAQATTPFWWISRDGRETVRWVKADRRALKQQMAGLRQRMDIMKEAE
jgi:hypothetical protein